MYNIYGYLQHKRAMRVRVCVCVSLIYLVKCLYVYSLTYLKELGQEQISYVMIR